MIVPDDAVVYAPAVAAWLLAQPPLPGGSCNGWIPKYRHRRAGVTLADGGRIAAGAVLLANGLQARDTDAGVAAAGKEGSSADHRSLPRH